VIINDGEHVEAAEQEIVECVYSLGVERQVSVDVRVIAFRSHVVVRQMGEQPCPVKAAVRDARVIRVSQQIIHPVRIELARDDLLEDGAEADTPAV